ncbi:hypothetical protein K443DRAFT_6054 [Laccaria amethystina LaAM-08-1]|uniref:NB-ARC domain-containing protein n=1 Tax=Laccaria amethystina LaAM-08-1 TaxID=1095629 RepID=A0A0C9WTW9_9AGAR|nr:hypothetical protein K443DRAFT_6054 [Laccaria amethystina LaAM-08-1]
MSGKQVFQGAQNFSISGGTFIAADSAREALSCPLSQANQLLSVQVKYYTTTGAGDRATSNAAIPVKPNSSIRFTGRTNVLAKLKEHFTAESNGKLRRRKFFLLYGMGGIGKTQICLRFIEDMSDCFSHVFWIDASSTDTITQGLKGICNLPEAQSSALDGSPQSALWWISSLGDNYAMVFDNADNLTPEELEQYFPSGLGGNILITSRNSGLKHLTLHESSLEVKEMEEHDAISLLLKAACLDKSQEDLQAEASKVVNELFCIPLAIDQAGAFIAFGDTDIRDYLKEYSRYRERLLSCPAFQGASTYNRSSSGS